MERPELDVMGDPSSSPARTSTKVYEDMPAVIDDLVGKVKAAVKA